MILLTFIRSSLHMTSLFLDDLFSLLLIWVLSDLSFTITSFRSLGTTNVLGCLILL